MSGNVRGAEHPELGERLGLILERHFLAIAEVAGGACERRYFLRIGEQADEIRNDPRLPDAVLLLGAGKDRPREVATGLFANKQALALPHQNPADEGEDEASDTPVKKKTRRGSRGGQIDELTIIPPYLGRRCSGHGFDAIEDCQHAVPLTLVAITQLAGHRDCDMVPRHSAVDVAKAVAQLVAS